LVHAMLPTARSTIAALSFWLTVSRTFGAMTEGGGKLMPSGRALSEQPPGCRCILSQLLAQLCAELPSLFGCQLTCPVMI